MSHFNVYLKPFNEDGSYSDDWLDITEDVNFSSIGDIRQSVDDDEYDVGVFKFSDFNLELRNEHGRYSDVDGLKSIFRYKRADSLLKLTWVEADEEPYTGVCIAGDALCGNDEIEIFQGLLTDEATETDIKDQTARFRVRGRESIFAQVEAPFSSLANGDLVSAIIKDCLNQSDITSLLTYSSSNIVPGNDVVVDDVSEYQNKTVKEVLDDLLLISNSVLYVKDGTIYVSSRDGGSTVSETFYGQASNNGIESIISIEKLRTGLNQTFNYWTWAETTLIKKDNDSIALYGVRKKEISHGPITTDATREDLLTDLKDEFSTPKLSFVLKTPLSPARIPLSILDRVTVDYPTVFYTTEQVPVPVYGVSRYGESSYPLGEWSLTLGDNEPLKIMGKVIKIKDQILEFSLKRI